MKNNKSKRALLAGSALTLMGGLSSALMAAPLDGKAVLEEKCLVCHTQTGDAEAPYSRISQQRKTPEGWHMTINRMQRMNGLVISPEEVQAVVKYLADNQGLAPSETAPYRYVLEQQPNIVENVDPAYVEMCARCHSSARFGLQRRTLPEWQLHVNTHMAINPTTELHALARDRSWYDIAYNDVAPKLAQDFAFADPAWNTWKKAEKPVLSGSWGVAGFLPGKGDYSAIMTVKETAKDRYQVSLKGHYADGSRLTGEGTAQVYAGYEWRASLTMDGVEMRQVLAASEKGGVMSGRLFERQHDEIGGAFVAQTQGIVGVAPTALKQGQEQTLVITGQALKGKVTLGNGVEVIKEVSRSADRIVVQVKAKADAAVGTRTVQVGEHTAVDRFTVYDQIARVDVVPNESIARVGGNGGKLPKVQAAYRALAFSAGADGKAGTEDDLRLGYMPAAWSIAPFDDAAVHEKDTDYAGAIDANGIFTPGDAGLNPARKFSTNNVGNLKVVATVGEADNAVSGEAHLLVTVPSFIKRAIQ